MMPTDYTLLDATLEILLMLLAAFVLGWLFCWLMKKLFGNKQKDTIQQSQDVSSPRQRTGLSASSRERLYDPDVGIPRPDIDTSVDANIPTINEPTIQAVEIDTPDVRISDNEAKTPRPRIDLPDLKTPDINLPDLDIKGKVDASLDAGKGAIGKGIGAAAAGIGAIAVGASSLKDKAVDAVDDIDLSLKTPDVDLPDVETPDIDIDAKLPEVDVDLPSLDADVELPEIPDLTADIDLPDADLPDLTVDAKIPDVDMPDLDADIKLPDVDVPDLDADIKLPDVDVPDLSTELELPDVDLPEVTAPEIDAEIDLPGLNIDTPSVDIDLPDADLPSADIDLADLPKSSVDIDTPDVSGALDTAVDSGKGLLSKGLGAAAAGIGAVTAGAANLKDKAADKVDELGDSLTSPDLPASKVKSSSDDLTRIDGIDKSIATLLNKQGINTYKQLRDTDRSTLKTYIDEAGTDSLKEIEPASWPHQAKLCAEKNWVKLSEYQSFLSGRSIDLTTSGSGASFSDAVKDDLKKIEGIGPFFESLLNKAGITTYEQLKDTDRDTLKEIIDAAGPDYRMHEPETWPYQAGLADQGDWKKLQDYIHFMTGRN